MRCPHCNVEIRPIEHTSNLGSDKHGIWAIQKLDCPNDDCGRSFFFLLFTKSVLAADGSSRNQTTSILAHPKKSSHSPLAADVPKSYADEYDEACAVLEESPKASAALSRRLLQTLLREEAKVKPADLSNEIDEVLGKNSLPSRLAESIDAIRNIGNFATHPIKSKNSTEIVPVEPGEAEWTLDVLESLFDFYFVQPALLKRKKDALNQKLREAGKPEMK